jgi:hypothetical protein
MSKRKKKGSSLGENLCKDCKFRYRRVFSPLRPDQYVDDDGEEIFNGKEPTIIIVNLCLLTGIDISEETSIECTHFKDKDTDSEVVPLFKHL